METVRQTLIDRKVITQTVFNNVTLSGSYQNSESIEICGASKGAVIIDYDRGTEETESTLVFKLSFSHDGTNWFQETSETLTPEPVQHTVDPDSAMSTQIIVPFDIPPAGYMRMSVKEDGAIVEDGTVTAVVSWMP